MPLASKAAVARVKVAVALLLVLASVVELFVLFKRYQVFAAGSATAMTRNASNAFLFQELTTAHRVGGVLAILVLVLALLWGMVRGLRRLGRAGRRALLVGLTIFFLLAGVALSFWARTFPPSRGTSFDLLQEIVHVGQALSATFFVICCMALLLPVVLNMLEGSSFVSFVAARHVRSSKSGFLTVISVLSIAGVGVSSFALCAVVSIMGGFGADLKRKILGNSSHISIDTDSVNGFGGWDDLLDQVRLAPGVRAATPMAGGEAMASSQMNTSGLIVRGIDPDSIGSVIDLVDNIEVGKLEYLVNPRALLELPATEEIGIGPGGMRYLAGVSPEANAEGLDPDVAEVIRASDVYPGIILGRELAKTLHVFVGDEVTAVAPLGDLGPMGVMPKTKRFRVAAIFYSGMYEYDANHAYVTLTSAQELFDLEGKVTSLDIKVDDAENVAKFAPGIVSVAAPAGLRVRDWKERNKNLFSALALEKIATFIILSIAIAVASFCIICTLLLMVTEKSKEIAIFKSMGASDTEILKVFMTEGVIIGAIGTVFGVVTGLTMCLALQTFGVRLDPEVYYVDRLPINVDGLEYLFVATSALVITIIATIYPAVAASRLRPVEGIRYE